MQFVLLVSILVRFLLIKNHTIFEALRREECISSCKPILSVFREDHTNFLVKPKYMKHDLMVEAQYEINGPAVACHDSMLSLRGEESSRIFTVLCLLSRVEYLA